MCGPNTIGLPNTAGSRMLWPPVAHEAAADEHDRARSDRSCASSPMVSRITTSTRGSASIGRSRAPRTFRSPPARPAARPRRSARGGAAPAPAARSTAASSCSRRNARSTSRLFALHRAAGDEHRPRRRNAEVAQHAIARRAPASAVDGSSSESNFRLPVTTTRAGIGAELDEAARRLFALHAEAVDVGEHAPHHRPDQPVARERPRREPAVDHRGLDAAARGTRAAGSARSRSPSSRRASAAPDRACGGRRSRGRTENRTPRRRPGTLRRASCCPAMRRRRQEHAQARDSARFRSLMSGRAVSTSPTDTAWIQIDASPSMLNDTGR